VTVVPPPAAMPDGVDATLERIVGPFARAELAEGADGVVSLLVDDLHAIDARLADVLRSTYPLLTESAIYASQSGGKRVRPLLMAAAYRSLGATSTAPIHSLAAAFQLIHTATLVHDDVIDHAELRRGRPSVPRAFGLPAAIVTGDYLFVRAFELAAEYARPIVLRCGEACADLAEGEILQENARFDLTTGREHYYRVVERKTAAIVSASLAAVGDIAGRPAGVVEGLASYGRALGIAFQLRDDLLDTYGDPDLTGKPLYADFREGNPTLVALEAHEALEGNLKAEFERLFALRRKQPRDLLRLRALTDSTEAPDRVAREATEWAERAVRSLDALPSGPFHTLLERLARGAAVRPY
jgi:octaprenyl-diphosphate synthase